jgi:hypothetical protein
MTKHLKLFLLALSAISFSCSDDDNPAKSNVLIVNSTSYSLDQAYTITVGGASPVYTIQFAEEGVTLIEYDTYDEIGGTGKVFYLEMEIDVTDGLAAGTYPASLVRYSELYEVVEGVGNTIEESIIPGNISVKKSGSTYTIDFTAEGNGSTYTIKYNGTLQTTRLRA